ERGGGAWRSWPRVCGGLAAIAAEPADDFLPQTEQRAVTPIGVANDLGAIKRRAQHGGMRHLAAQPAADAGIDDGRHRIAAQRIGRRLHRQRRAARQTNAGMVAGADFVVDAVARARDALAALELAGI